MLPTGVDARGYSVEVKGIVTKSVERLSLHLNAGYEFLTDTRDDERDGRYELALGFSYPVGAPQFTRATLVGDVFAEQAGHRGESTTVGTEVGAAVPAHAPPCLGHRRRAPSSRARATALRSSRRPGSRSASDKHL